MSGADTAHRNHLDALFRAHYRWLCTYLSRHLHDAAGAEDIAAETFAQLLQAPSITAIREPRAMLTTIAQRLLYQRWRRADLERRHAQQVDIDAATSPEDLAQLSQTLKRLDHSLQRLPGKVRSTFLLARIDGLTYPQIAAELGISVATVKRHLQKAALRCYFAL